MENFSGQLKKYKVTINDLLAENEQLEARAKASEKGSCLFGEIDRLLEQTGGDMLPACLAGTFPTLQVRNFSRGRLIS